MDRRVLGNGVNIAKLTAMAAAAIVVLASSGHSNAAGTFSLDGFYFIGTDWIVLGEQPEAPGVVDFGNGMILVRRRTG